MLLTAEEVRVGECVDALMRDADAGDVVTLSELTRFILEVAGISPADPSAYAAARLQTMAILRENHQALYNEDGKYSDASPDPRLTPDGIMQLLLNGNHPIAVAVRNHTGEMFRRTLDEALGPVSRDKRAV
jgi:hypothetical protein